MAAGPDAVPAGGENAFPALGRPGAPPGGITTPRQELADGREPQKGSGRKRGPRGRQNTAMERRGARVLRQGTPHRKVRT